MIYVYNVYSAYSCAPMYMFGFMPILSSHDPENKTIMRNMPTLTSAVLCQSLRPKATNCFFSWRRHAAFPAGTPGELAGECGTAPAKDLGVMTGLMTRVCECVFAREFCVRDNELSAYLAADTSLPSNICVTAVGHMSWYMDA